jgi:hypothetical protein
VGLSRLSVCLLEEKGLKIVGAKSVDAKKCPLFCRRSFPFSHIYLPSFNFSSNFLSKILSKMALLPVEHSKPIPRGTKVRFRQVFVLPLIVSNFISTNSQMAQ